MEARRRAARVGALFEIGWQHFEHAMNRHVSPPQPADFQQAFAQQLLDILRSNVEQASRLQAQLLPQAKHEAALQTIDAASRRQITAASPVAPDRARPTEIDDPEFEAALLEMADRKGWWHDDPDEIVAQFDNMLVGLITL